MTDAANNVDELNNSDIATLLRAFEGYRAQRIGEEVHIPAGQTRSGREVPALSIRLEGDTLVVEALAGDARAPAPAEECAWALGRIRAVDPARAGQIEAASLDALGVEDATAMQEAASGIDDRADGLPSLEEALSLLDGIAREMSDDAHEVVPLQGALRAVAANNPECLLRPPILPALVKLGLDSRPDWNRVKAMLGRPLPPGLADTIRDECSKVAASRQRRIARRAARRAAREVSGILGDFAQTIEAGPEIDSIVEALKNEPNAALTAETLDALLALRRRIGEDLDAIKKAREEAENRRRANLDALMGDGSTDAEPGEDRGRRHRQGTRCARNGPPEDHA